MVWSLSPGGTMVRSDRRDCASISLVSALSAELLTATGEAGCFGCSLGECFGFSSIRSDRSQTGELRRVWVDPGNYLRILRFADQVDPN